LISNELEELQLFGFETVEHALDATPTKTPPTNTRNTELMEPIAISNVEIIETTVILKPTITTVSKLVAAPDDN